ncbi:MAG TPA: creatininase family protein [Spirochaetia bacterium]|nr:creatininase family protein [Spirochaetia bacterium]
MTIYRLDQMTWEDVAALDRDRTIFFLPISPIEEHGPHLPLGTDIYAATDMAEMALNILEKRDSSMNYVFVPGIPVGCTRSAMAFPGTISLRKETLTNLVYDICASIAGHEFKYIVIANHHLDPVHIKALLDARKMVMEEYPVKVIEVAGTILFSGDNPRDNFLAEMGCDARKEIHADVKETSFIKYNYPNLLRDSYKSLKPVHVDIAECIRQGITGMHEMGAEKGYIGTPSLATAEYGKHYLEKGATNIADLALRLYNNEPIPEISKKMMHILANIVE